MHVSYKCTMSISKMRPNKTTVFSSTWRSVYSKLPRIREKERHHRTSQECSKVKLVPTPNVWFGRRSQPSKHKPPLKNSADNQRTSHFHRYRLTVLSFRTSLPSNFIVHTSNTPVFSLYIPFLNPPHSRLLVFK